MIKGGPAGPDAQQADGLYRQEVDSDRAALWDSLGARQGILRGFTHTLVSGQLSIDFAAGAAAVEERDGAGALGLGRGYHVWADVTTRVTHAAAEAQARSDAVVIAFVDSEDGAIGSAVTQVGGQIVVVKGVAGSTTPRTDAQITTALGRGGWIRYADVRIDPGNTQVNPANVTLAADARVDTWRAYTPVLTGFTADSVQAYWKQDGKTVTVSFVANVTGGSSAGMTVALPVAAARVPSARMPLGPVVGTDSSVPSNTVGGVYLATASTVSFTGGAGTSWGPNVPFTWASGDKVGFTITYERA